MTPRPFSYDTPTHRRTQSPPSVVPPPQDDDDSTTRSRAAAAASHHPHKGVFAGSGSDAMFDPRMCETILSLVSNHKKPPRRTQNNNNKKIIQVVYLGTATYDLEQFQYRQTQRLKEAGCQVTHLKLTDQVPSNRISLLDQADIILVGGGNTLFAMDRWATLGIVDALHRAWQRGCVLAGGSAGAICWFDGGHSNVMDPDTYKAVRVEKFGGPANPDMATDEIYATSEGTPKDWEYIRITALGMLPGLVSPHHDRVQSNGVLRADDFDKCLQQHPGERGIGIDHWAALVIDGDEFRVVSLEDKEGSVGPHGNFVTDGSGVPGVWIKEVVNGKVERRLCPSQGWVSDSLVPATKIVEDLERMNECRRQNVDDGPLPNNEDDDKASTVVHTKSMTSTTPSSYYDDDEAVAQIRQ